MITRLRRPLIFCAVAAVLGAVAVSPPASRVLSQQGGDGVQQGPSQVDAGPDTGGDTTGPDTGSGPSGNGPGAGPKKGLTCTRSGNGGKTDRGVSADRIRLASTVVQSGAGSSFLGASPIGMQAVVRKVNREGGICGRLLELTLADDGWDPERGLKFIKTFVNEDYFAMPVVPSSEGLTAAIESGDIGKAGMPVVGSDGMLIQQYKSPWVWPVATATVSTMRIMAKHAYDKGARSFAIVYDTFYRFGREGAEAFRDYVKTLPGAKMTAYVGILPAQASYSSDIQRFNSSCNNACDFVGLLLEPQTALTWIAGRPQFGTLVTGGAQTLFNEQFAANCGKPCNGMLVWTGYNPPIGNLAGLPDVSEYVNDVRRISPTVDVTNQFLEGAYLGMTVFVEALRRVGPNLTRERLRETLNSMRFESDLSGPLQWSAKRRHANRRAQAFSIVVAQGSFAGFRQEQTGFIADPKPE